MTLILYGLLKCNFPLHVKANNKVKTSNLLPGKGEALSPRFHNSDSPPPSRVIIYVVRNFASDLVSRRMCASFPGVAVRGWDDYPSSAPDEEVAIIHSRNSNQSFFFLLNLATYVLVLLIFQCEFVERKHLFHFLKQR